MKMTMNYLIQQLLNLINHKIKPTTSSSFDSTIEGGTSTGEEGDTTTLARVG